MQLNDLRNGTPGITPDYGGCLCDAASVCLENRAHTSGVVMAVTGGALAVDQVTVIWPDTSDQMRRCYGDLQFATEFGAYGVAVLLIEQLTELTVYERSRKGTGFDYWLAPKGSSAPLFQDKRRLEASGLLDGDESDIKSRLKQKQTQMAHGGIPLVGYGIVVHFGRPESRVSKESP
jgi:hypothetical protein